MKKKYTYTYSNKIVKKKFLDMWFCVLFYISLIFPSITSETEDNTKLVSGTVNFGAFNKSRGELLTCMHNKI